MCCNCLWFVRLPRGAVGLSGVYDRGIFSSFISQHLQNHFRLKSIVLNFPVNNDKDTDQTARMTDAQAVLCHRISHVTKSDWETHIVDITYLNVY